jgi:glutamate---cysteine ligase / carboxylate-amine ligase
MRSVGIEEELLVVDGETGRPISVAQRVIKQVEETEAADSEKRAEKGPGGTVGAELQQQQLETDTPVRTELADLDADVRTWRDVAIVAARKTGARVVASGTSPMPVQPEPVPDERYLRIAEQFGLTTAEQLTCGCHVHVSVASDDEGVAVLDRIRVWLPSLLALSANSPFWQGADSHYASFRSQAMIRWPSAGPTGVFGSAAAYHSLVSAMVASGVLLDEGMVYFDARLSRQYPTVEIRAADVCMDARDAVLVAGLCRGLVETAARDWNDGRAAPNVPTEMLRLATWQAGRFGIDGDLLDPLTGASRPSAEILDALVEYVGPALDADGDLDLVTERLAEVRDRGNGARRQRSVLERTNRIGDVVADVARVTAGQHG